MGKCEYKMSQVAWTFKDGGAQLNEKSFFLKYEEMSNL